MGYALKVLDLSHHNVITSFEMIYDFGIRGVILKSTQGTGYVDPTYEPRRVKAEAAGLLVGAYHFADGSDTQQQLQHFLDVSAIDEKMLGALDYEPSPSGATMTLDNARDFLQNYELVVGRKAKLYAGSLIKETLGNNRDDFLAQHDLWLAQYGSAPRPPANWASRVWLWQYSDGARDYGAHLPIRVSGIEPGGLDCDAFAGSDEDLATSWVS